MTSERYKGLVRLVRTQNCKNNAESLTTFIMSLHVATPAVAPHNDPHPLVVIEHQSSMSFLLFLKNVMR